MINVAEGEIHIRDFPPFIRFVLEEGFRRKIFAKFLKSVREVEVDLPPEEFWSSAEEEFEKLRYELIFGKVTRKDIKNSQKKSIKC